MVGRQFLELPEEKRLRILNAAFEVFGTNSYRQAITDDIAVKAGISKGLLFYYFHNKQSLYLYLFEYCEQTLRETVMSKGIAEITDFFELMEYGAERKGALLSRYPYMMEFVMRAYYSENETVSDAMQQRMKSLMESIYPNYFTQINWSKFREGIDPSYLVRMLTWMTDGYLHEKQRARETVDLEEVMRDFNTWKELFRAISYKPEFLEKARSKGGESD